MKVDKSSWHYKLAYESVSQNDHRRRPSENLCPYTREVLWACVSWFIGFSTPGIAVGILSYTVLVFAAVYGHWFLFLDYLPVHEVLNTVVNGPGGASLYLGISLIVGTAFLGLALLLATAAAFLFLLMVSWEQLKDWKYDYDAAKSRKRQLAQESVNPEVERPITFLSVLGSYIKSMHDQVCPHLDFVDTTQEEETEAP